MSVAYAGERGSFAELAAVEYFHGREKSVSVADFDAVFEAVSRGKTEWGIVPIENSLAGSIHQNYDSFLEHKLYICGELNLRISHYLIANRGTQMRNVKQIYSHPQALAQCKQYLRAYRSIEQVPVSNTAVAVKKIKDERMSDAAAIGSMQACIDYRMHILAKNIEDNELNMTRFIILAKKPAHRALPAQEIKTSIVFSLVNEPGVLFKALSVFALRDIDLLKIESRPVMSGKFEYIFYLDFAGRYDDKRQQNALNHLQEITSMYRLLGSYPVGKTVHPQYRERK
jgi:prephenate dehydratase